MTTVVFYKSNGVYYGFEEQGHTGYADEGNDILCAALSAMTMLIINAIEVTYASHVDYTIDEVTTNITLVAKSALKKFEPDERKQYAISGLITAYFYQLRELTEEYGSYLTVRDEERPLK